MRDRLKDVGDHLGYDYSVNGHYEATVDDGDKVTITTIFNVANQPHTVTLSKARWDRLVAWVEWQRKDKASHRPVKSN